MKIIVKWTQSNQVPIVALSVDPVHNQLIVGIGKTIVFFDALTGKELIAVRSTLKISPVFPLGKTESSSQVAQKTTSFTSGTFQTLRDRSTK